MRFPTAAPLLIVLCILLTGCEHGKDSHTEVFQTTEQAAASRGERLRAAHQELAISVLHFARPDIEAKPAASGQITVAADGLTQPIDLAPIEADLNNHANQERAILRKYLETQVKPFDGRRIREVGFEKLKGFLRFDLMNDRVLASRQQAAGTQKLLAAKVVPGLFRVTIIRRPGADVPVTDEVLSAWHTTSDAVDAAAFEALRGIIRDAGDKLFESTAYSTFGRTGTLRSDPAVVLLPEFLAAVQKSWQSTDDLLLIIPAPHGVQFIESHNQRLKAIVVPRWQQQLATSPDVLFEYPLLRTKEKLEIHIPAPDDEADGCDEADD